MYQCRDLTTAAGTADVAAAVQWAVQHGVPLAVKCGGHGGARWAEGALLLDLTCMRSVYVDPAARVAVVDGGAQVRRAAASFPPCDWFAGQA